MIYTHGLHFAYHQSKQFSFPDLHCEDGETLLILGESGKGKTTLLHTLGLLIKPDRGQMVLDGRNLEGLTQKEMVQTRAQQIGIIYQKAHFVSSLSVRDNLLLANYLGAKEQDAQKVKYLSEELGFAGHLDKRPWQLSQGEQQRVSIARCLMNSPRLLLADEPTSSLDDNNCHKVIGLLKAQSEAIGASLLVVTHDQRLKDEFPNRVFL
ncbi:putative ABC transport system ATP-binding protein [Dyadobacter jejuensis]|uniref:Putative ABC transport system ATP-binding protein n=1 Tax=Dyadobacter jejuensis TaxID=1082580 RepID=A0A316AJ92_9BACT|nr:ATP-binding cassette domain-containing protein [Dyadobacter jejuensis]PWJ56940.1 putative ABC transport system ATP-binding protein [Dyadobacter jejuensis]